MKKLLIMFSTSAVLMSCGVQQFSVNTKVEPFENGGRVFGETTKKLKKGEDYTKSGTLFLIGVNLLSDYDTDEMAKKINAEHFTIETKSNFLSFLCSSFTGGIVNYKVVKVIKRAE
jgi:hypothetical protein